MVGSDATAPVKSIGQSPRDIKPPGGQEPMQQVVIAKPYQFVPPHHGTFWPWLLQKWLPGPTRRRWGVERPEFHGLERLRASLQAGHGVILAPNHCRPCDPFILMLLGAELRQPFYAMA